MIEIGKLFNIEKGSLQSSKCTPGQYAFITAGEEWKTHIEYTHDCEALVFAMAASGSLGRTHYVNGKFIASDLCFILTPKKEYISKVNLRFYSFYFNTYRERIVKATATGTSKLAINRKSFSNYQIYLVDIERQNQLLHKLDKMKSISDGLLQTIQQQQKYADMLRQSVLQQAVEGKLCEQDPKDEPASVLLEKINAEKERLIAEKKIKKQKPLPPISDEERPFALPKGWEWCRLGNVCDISDGTHQTPSYVEAGMPFMSAQNIKPFKFMPHKCRMVSNNDYEQYIKNTKPVKGDILMARVGAGIGEAAIIDTEIDFAIYVSLCLLKPFLHTYDMNYLLVWLNGYYGRNSSKKNTLGKGTSQGNLNLNLIRGFVIPFPPIQEQLRIINRVNLLTGLCDKLEQEVAQATHYASQLMEAVLQEAFSVQEAAKSVQIIEFHPDQTTSETELLAAARGKIRDDTWEHLCKRALEIAGEES